MKRRTTVIKVATKIGVRITSKERIKEKDQETTKEMSKGKKGKSKKIVHLLKIGLLSRSSM